MRFFKLTAMILCICTLLSIVACKPNSQTPEDTTTADTTIEEITTEPDVEPEPPVDAIEAQKKELETIKNGIGATTDTVLYVKDFGAVGDGKTNDGDAIYAALTAAAEQHATVKFEENKTDYVSSVTGRISFRFS